jgi:hypothetical protein
MLQRVTLGKIPEKGLGRFLCDASPNGLPPVALTAQPAPRAPDCAIVRDTCRIAGPVKQEIP